jgi:hypothetical protein
MYLGDKHNWYALIQTKQIFHTRFYLFFKKLPYFLESENFWHINVIAEQVS